MAITTPTSVSYSAIAAGDVFSVGPNWGEKSVPANNNQVWVKGDLLQVHATTGVVSLCAASSTTLGKFLVAARPKTLTAAEGIVFGKDAIDKIALEVDAAVEPYTSVAPGTTANVTAFVEGTTAEYLEVGTYLGHVNEVGTGQSPAATNAAATDIGIIEINPANWA
jgi:hypothetical protein